MVPFDRPCMTFYWSAIVSIVPFSSYLESNNIVRDLEIWLRGHSVLLELVPFESLVTMALSCIVCEISRVTGRKIPHQYLPPRKGVTQSKFREVV